MCKKMFMQYVLLNLIQVTHLNVSYQFKDGITNNDFT